MGYRFTNGQTAVCVSVLVRVNPMQKEPTHPFEGVGSMNKKL